MTFSAIRFRMVFAVPALLVFVAVLWRWPVHALLIHEMETSLPVFVRLVRPGDRLSIGFIHSVENCRVWDHLQVNNHYGLVVVGTEFAESRTGLPHAAFKQEIFERREDHFRITNMNRPVPGIYQWVDAKYENTLKIDGKQEIQLASLAGDCLLHIHISSLTGMEWAWLKAKLCWQHWSP
ncbi:MAG TPA: DUF1850 domain-containing protein [Desulfobacteraceae bacterium]|nr:DUF1850 domain-containing protein [Desulfobacteraceae bacterium]